MRRALGVLQAEKHHAVTPALHVALAEGLLKAGEIDEAAAVIDAGLDLNKASGETLNVPELLRVRGEISLRATPADPVAAERAFQLSLQQAREQSALSLELRSAMSLSRLWSSQGKSSEAACLLESCYRRFAEGYQTTDLIRSRQLLTKLGRCAAPLATTSGRIWLSDDSV